jgi:hypothetical protein
MPSAPPLSAFQTVLISVITTLVTTFVVGLPLWAWQQKRLQRWGSRPVVEFGMTPRKVLSIRNTGDVDITDVQVFFTQYSIQSEERQPGNIYLGEGLDGQVSAAFSPLKTFTKIGAGETSEWDMWNDKGLQNPKRFYTVEEASRDTLKVAKTQYAIRVVFRNAVSKQRFISYQMIPAVEGPAEFMPSPGTSIGGPVEGLDKFFKMREAIRQHQAKLFDDADSELYR